LFQLQYKDQLLAPPAAARLRVPVQQLPG